MTERGRPTDYRPEYCERVIELGKQGKSQAQIADALDTSRASLKRWCDAHEDFRTALSRAHDASQAWWEDKGQDNLLTAGFNAAVWRKSMEARFRDDYTERSQHELTGKDGGPIKTEISARDIIASRIARMSVGTREAEGTS